MIEVRRLGHATFTTRDLDREVHYWTNVIGLCLVHRDADRAFLATKLGQEAIALERGEPGRLKAIAFQVAPGTSLRDVEAGLAEHGVKTERRSDISPGVKEAVTFSDLKGTELSVFNEYEFAKDDGLQLGIMPIKFGHLAYRVTDPKKHADFYCQVLGFRVSDWISDRFSFLRCGPDHHTINFARYKEEALHHIAFEVKDVARSQSGLRLPRQEEHPPRVGSHPPHRWPQYRGLPQDRRRHPSRAVLRARPDEGRGARLFRPASLARRPPAASQGLARRYTPEPMGVRVVRHVPGLSLKPHRIESPTGSLPPPFASFTE